MIRLYYIGANIDIFMAVYWKYMYWDDILYWDEIYPVDLVEYLCIFITEW